MTNGHKKPKKKMPAAKPGEAEMEARPKQQLQQDVAEIEAPQAPEERQQAPGKNLVKFERKIRGADPDPEGIVPKEPVRLKTALKIDLTRKPKPKPQKLRKEKPAENRVSGKEYTTVYRATKQEPPPQQPKISAISARTRTAGLRESNKKQEEPLPQSSWKIRAISAKTRTTGLPGSNTRTGGQQSQQQRQESQLQRQPSQLQSQQQRQQSQLQQQQSQQQRQQSQLQRQQSQQQRQQSQQQRQQSQQQRQPQSAAKMPQKQQKPAAKMPQQQFASGMQQKQQSTAEMPRQPTGGITLTRGPTEGVTKIKKDVVMAMADAAFAKVAFTVKVIYQKPNSEKKTFEVKVSPSVTVFQLKKKISRLLGTQPRVMNLTYKNGNLSSGHTLRHYKLREGDTIHCTAGCGIIFHESPDKTTTSESTKQPKPETEEKMRQKKMAQGLNTDLAVATRNNEESVKDFRPTVKIQNYYHATLKVNIFQPGKKQTMQVEVDIRDSVLQLKEKLKEKLGVSVAKMNLTFKGVQMVDKRSLIFYKLLEGSVVTCTIGAGPVIYRPT